MNNKESFENNPNFFSYAGCTRQEITEKFTLPHLRYNDKSSVIEFITACVKHKINNFYYLSKNTYKNKRFYTRIIIGEGELKILFYLHGLDIFRPIPIDFDYLLLDEAYINSQIDRNLTDISSPKAPFTNLEKLAKVIQNL